YHLSSLLYCSPSSTCACSTFFLFNHTAPTEIYTLSLHDALPILHILGFLGMPRRIYTYDHGLGWAGLNAMISIGSVVFAAGTGIDRKSTRLNSSHDQISYAVFCLKKKKQKKSTTTTY